MKETAPVKEPVQAVSKVSYGRPFVVLNLKEEPNASCLNYWNKTQLDSLKSELNGCMAIFGEIRDNKSRIECTVPNVQYDALDHSQFMKFKLEWERKVENCLKTFFTQFKRSRVQVNNAQEIINVKFIKKKLYFASNKFYLISNRLSSMTSFE